MDNELQIKFHKTFDGYLAKINIPPTVVKHSTDNKQPDFVLLVDKSGSMGQNVGRIINKILPQTLKMLGYQDSNKIHIIAYDNFASYYHTYIKFLTDAKIGASGGTNLAPGLKKLESIISNLSKNIRLLHISDGQIFDIKESIRVSELINTKITNKRQINSQAIRYMTGGEPDTRGLSSTLKFGNVMKSQLKDIMYVINENGYTSVAKEIYEQFENDGLDYKIELSVNDNIIMNNPWDDSVKKINLQIGENTIWFKNIPDSIVINGIDVEVKILVSDTINSDNIDNIISERLNYYMDRIRILKVVNTAKSQDEISNILVYFENFQNYLNTQEITPTSYSPDLKFRYNNIKRNIEQHRRSLFMKLKQLANDDIVSQLNSAQQADYLRGVELSKNTKGLARRAMKSGFDLTSVIHDEVIAIYNNIKELDDINDDDHIKSFYSMETTLEGIKTLVKLVDDKLLDETAVSDIIQLANIVGIACYHPIGDYPDAMAFRVHDIFPGVYISVSDITVYQTLSSNSKFRPPGFPDKEIVNTIPIFDDARIHQFMLKYAPNILNLSAGVGMRRVMADIPSTHMYTICAGLWTCINMFSTNRTEIMIKTIKKLADTYDIDVGGYFDHNEAFLIDQNTQTSYFINNNGLTNMLNLLHRQYKKNNIKNMSRIIRAIYCYEFYQSTKKIIAKANNKTEFIENTLSNLLGLNYDKYGSKVGELFTETPKPKHDTTYTINTELLNKLTPNFKYFENLYLVPLIFEALESGENYILKMKEIPDPSNELLLKQIDVKYDFQSFLVYSLVESIIYNTKQLRVNDKSEKQMSLPDIGFVDETNKMIRKYTVDYYQKSYNHNLRQKTRDEYEVTLQKMNEKICECDINSFIDIMANGFKYKNRSSQIVNTSSQGFNEFAVCLQNIDIDIYCRFQKLWVFILGKDLNGNNVWNGGNAIRTKLTQYQNIFEHFDKEDLWKILYQKYANSITHIYRGDIKFANRHGHHNEKPSYWALGFKTVKDMETKISKDEYETYAVCHCECCGFNQVSMYQRKKLARKAKSLSGASSYEYY
jgi:hypothetical protein